MAVDQVAALSTLKLMLFFLLLLAASTSDIHNRTIPYIVCVLITLTGLIDFSPARLWGVFLAAPFFVASGFKRGGAGDIYLVATSSVVLGLECGVIGLLNGLTMFCLFYLVAGINRKFKGQKDKQVSYPLAPFLSIGFLAATIINGGISK